MYLLPSLDVLLIAGRAVALLVAFVMFAWAFRHWRRAATRDTQRVFEQLDLVRSELLIMREVMHGATRKSNLKSEVESMSNPKVERRSETRAPAMANGGMVRGYEIAARLARGGAQQDELMKSCGVTTHEADLLVKLHGRKNALPSNIANVTTTLNPRTLDKNELAIATGAAHVAKPIAQPRVSQPLSSQRATQSVVKAPVSAARPQPMPPPAPQFRSRSRLMAVG
jgi:hypothetical protein